jgi:hypothetical protein
VSIRNARTGRHEDDLLDEYSREGGSVTLRHLLDHLNETVVEVPSAFGSNVCAPVKMATLLLERMIAEGKVPPDLRVGL